MVDLFISRVTTFIRVRCQLSFETYPLDNEKRERLGEEYQAIFLFDLGPPNPPPPLPPQDLEREGGKPLLPAPTDGRGGQGPKLDKQQKQSGLLLYLYRTVLSFGSWGLPV
jgi:hypothetical protein